MSSIYGKESWTSCDRKCYICLSEALAQSHTPLNILGGFKKAGIYPFNPGEVSDRQLAPSTVFKKKCAPQVPTFTPEQIAKFEARYEED